MLEKRTIVDQIEVTRNGTLQIRMSLQIIEDGNVLDARWHRTAVPPGVDIDQQMQFVNDHLATMSRPALPAEEIDRIKTIAAAAWTDEVISDYRAMIEQPVES